MGLTEYDEVIKRLKNKKGLGDLGLKLIDNLDIKQADKLLSLNDLIAENDLVLNEYSNRHALFNLSLKLEKIGLIEDSENLIKKAYQLFFINPYIDEYFNEKSDAWYSDIFSKNFVNVVEKVLYILLIKKKETFITNIDITPYLTQRFIYECNNLKLKSKLISLKHQQSEQDILNQLDLMKVVEEDGVKFDWDRDHWDLLQSPIAGMNDKLLASKKIKQKALDLSPKHNFFYHLKTKEELLNYFKKDKFGISAYPYLPINYQNDREIIIKSVQQLGNTCLKNGAFSTRYLNTDILLDLTFIKQILEIDGSNILKFGDSILKNYDLVTTSINNWAKKYVSYSKGQIFFKVNNEFKISNFDFEKVTVFFKENDELLALLEDE